MKFTKSTFVAILYASATPMNVWTGVELGTGHYDIGVLLLVGAIIIDFTGVKLWFKAQIDEHEKWENDEE